MPHRCFNWECRNLKWDWAGFGLLELLCGRSLKICLANLILKDFLLPPTRLIAEGDAVSIEYEARGRTTRGEAYQNCFVTILTVRNDKVV
jgi:hypothetical protein